MGRYIPPGYELSVEGKRRHVTLEYLKKLTLDEETVHYIT